MRRKTDENMGGCLDGPIFTAGIGIACAEEPVLKTQKER